MNVMRKYLWLMVVLSLLSMTETACGTSSIEETKENQSREVEDTYSFVIDGIEFFVPYQYQSTLNDEWGLIILGPESLEMRVAVNYSSYEVFQKDLSRMTDVVERAGNIVTSGPEEIMVDGKSYLYLIFEQSGMKEYLIYTAADEYTIGVLVAPLEKSQLEVLELVHSIVGTAVVTDKSDSTYDEMILAQVRWEEEEYKAEGSLFYEPDDIEVHYQIPEGFYENESEVEETFRRMYFSCTKDRKIDILVTVQFIDSEVISQYDGPESYIQSTAWEDSAFEVSHTEINGYDVYYGSRDLAYIAKEDTSYSYHFYGVIPIADDIYYMVDGYSTLSEATLELETYRSFLTLE